MSNDDQTQTQNKKEMLQSVKTGDVNAVKKLLEDGFNPNEIYRFSKDWEFYGSLLHATLLKERDTEDPELTKKKFACYDLLLEAGLDLELPDTYWKLTILQWACREDQFEYVKYFVNKKSNINYRSSNYDYTPLLVSKSEEVIHYLLDHGANLDTKVLCFAIHDGYPWLVDKCLEAGIDVKDDSAYPFLHEAVSDVHFHKIEEHFQIVKRLVQAGANVNRQYDGHYYPTASFQNGNTPIFELKYTYNGEVAQYLLDNGADVSIRNENDQTVLEYCIEQDGGFIIDTATKEKLVEVLIQHGVDTNPNPKLKKSLGPLHGAAKKGLFLP